MAEGISLREYTADIAAAKELTNERVKRIDAALAHLKEMGESQRTADQLAVETALTAAKELAVQHNGLLRRMESLVETFATKPELKGLERWQAKATGVGMALVAGVLANFIKAWVS